MSGCPMFSKKIAVVGAAVAAVGGYVMYKKKQTAAVKAAKVTDAGKDAAENPKKNHAVMFLKPEVAGNAAVFAKVEEILAEKKIKICKAPVAMTGADIEKSKAVDLHYADIYAKAMKLAPKDLGTDNKLQEKFDKSFGEHFKITDFSWDKLASGNIAGHTVCNCREYMKNAGIDEKDAISKFLPIWNAGMDKARKSKLAIKLAGGFYAVPLVEEDNKVQWAVNGFWFDMRKSYVQNTQTSLPGLGFLSSPSVNVKVFEVCWDPKDISWTSFRDDVLGTTEPKDANKGSIRAYFLANKAAFGIKNVDKGANIAHASASPFEALRERLLWSSTQELSNADDFKFEYETDSQAKSWGTSVSQEMLLMLDANPNVTNKQWSEEESPAYDIFEGMEGDTVAVVEKLQEWTKLYNKGSKPDQ